MADGATYEEAVVNAQIVIAEWIETAKSLNRPIPEPKGKLAYACCHSRAVAGASLRRP